MYKVKPRYLTTPIALNVYSQLIRTYTLTIHNSQPSNITLDAIGISWLIALVTIISYLALLLQILLMPLLLAQLVKTMARLSRDADGYPNNAIESISIFLVSVFASMANFAGIIDITQSPLLADIFLCVWNHFSLISGVLALSVLPIFMCIRQSQLPWHLLYLPAIMAASTASELTTIVEDTDASGLLMNGYLLWGIACIPALAFAISYIRRNLEEGLMPLAVVSQLSLSVMTLGIHGRRVWAESKGPSKAPLLLGELAMAWGAVGGVVLWAMSLVWFVSAHANLWRHRRINGWEGVFPLASFALASVYVVRIWGTGLVGLQLLFVYVSGWMAGTIGVSVKDLVKKRSVRQPIVVETTSVYGTI